MIEYYKEWGVPQHDNIMLFELLTLEGARGDHLSPPLKSAYRKAFDIFLSILKISRTKKSKNSDISASTSLSETGI
jgi:3-methyladenine DNA glycosylase Tag